jgi:hypothetical protein
MFAGVLWAGRASRCTMRKPRLVDRTLTTLSAPAETKASPEAVTASELSSADCEPSRMRMAEPSYASQYVIFRSDPVVSSWLSSG